MKEYTKNYQEALHDLWLHFIRGEEADYSVVRPEILDSWKRSRDAGVNPYEPMRRILSPEELNIRINANMDLIDVVRPYMERLYSVVKNSGFYILFCDKEGYLLDLLGDPEIVDHVKVHSLMVAGANRRESAVGTNGIGTCLAMRKPVQIWGEEHYLLPHKSYVCSGAPFFNNNGDIAGCLNLTGRSADVHPHTLGMVISAADGITKELSIRKAYEDIELISAQRNSIIQSMTSGIILLNNAGRVIQVNDVALNMLDLRFENILGRNLFDLISIDGRHTLEDNMSVISREQYNKEASISRVGSLQPPKRFHISTQSVRDTSGLRGSIILRLNESSRINKLAGSVSGFRARYTFDSIIGTSEATQRLTDTCRKSAASDSNILILGESGTGKELLAQAIHQGSSFASGPFVAVNCASLPRNLVESELFGYEKGAFTGANKDGNPGKFELADGGTIFLDEIGDMPLDVQASLLRVIQDREVVRIGGKYPKSINVRVIAATNKDLHQAVAEKSFREDLYYRLNVMTIEVPPLRNRAGDVRLLTEYFIEVYGSGRKIQITPQAMEIMERYPWPGNVRQLENTIERAINICEQNTIQAEDLPSELLRYETSGQIPPAGQAFPQAIPAAQAASPVFPAGGERFYGMPAYPDAAPQPPKPGIRSTREEIIAALEEAAGNVTQAGKALGMSRRTMYRRLEQFGIDYEQYR
ncbi:MAG: sigma-54-dependent Fis family transcriptional regulator [Firmicutes bacterium]|nr:sigma-54-dependent Fis family transcriptional regulator [Bacillota bacterium]